MGDFSLEYLQPAVQMLESCYTFDPSYIDQQDNSLLDGSVFLLGKEFTKADGIAELKEYVSSRLWFTYRRNFAPIGGTGPESDQGWGCMLRCAQMLLAETLMRRHIGSHVKWTREPPQGHYRKILEMFLDQKTALYSIHQIAQMGVSEGKAVGEWFGPNTAAQVIKKLAVFDTYSNIAVHVALDNILVSNDVRTMATVAPPEDAVKIIMEDGLLDESLVPSSIESLSSTIPWRPILLLIPLRLGLTTINRCYLPAIQEFFKLSSCVGIIGGRPNLAHYFIGISDDKLIYLDPHYCRPSLTENKKVIDDGFDKVELATEALPSLSSFDENSPLDDTTFHCQMLLHMNYDQVDPSLALAFYCESSESFDQLCLDLKQKVFPSSSPPIFEQMERRPKYWPKFEPYVGVRTKIEMKEFDDMCAPNYNIDDDFELLEEGNYSNIDDNI